MEGAGAAEPVLSKKDELTDLENRVHFLMRLTTAISVGFVSLLAAFLVMSYLQMEAIKAIPMHFEDISKQNKVLDLKYDSQAGSGILNWKTEDYVSFAEYGNGFITIKTDGTYLVYAQISFDVASGKLAFIVDLDGTEFIKCTWAESGIEEEWLYPCHTSRAIYLKTGQELSVKVAYDHLTIESLHAMTFWGVLKIY